MQIIVAGASGLIGSHVVSFLGLMGHRVQRLVRRDARSEDTDIPWNPGRQQLDAAALDGAEALICLSGENIASRWNAEKKERLLASRVDTVSLLCRTAAAMEAPPEVIVCASAMGYYGANRGDEVLTEESSVGSDFLAALCAKWEAAAQPALERGIRVVHLRFGIVLSRKGGPLRKMLLPFWLGLGGRIGDGRQFMSWLSLDEAVGIIDFAIQTDALEGAVNAMTPNPVTNSEFTQTLGAALWRPTFFPVPKAVVRLAFGEMGEALLLGSTRALPKKLEAAGYTFRYPDLRQALDQILRDG